MTHRTAIAAIALVLALGACGRVGPPVRSRPTLETAAGASAGEQPGEDRESEKEKP
jgi:predicted small lipoprotein YifL